MTDALEQEKGRGRYCRFSESGIPVLNRVRRRFDQKEERRLTTEVRRYRDREPGREESFEHSSPLIHTNGREFHGRKILWQEDHRDKQKQGQVQAVRW